MKRDIKILCVCRSGRTRSVLAKTELNRRGYLDVIAVGGLKLPPRTLNMLCDWAEVILLAKPRHGKYIDLKYKEKIVTEFYIGDDLEGMIKKQLNKIGLI